MQFGDKVFLRNLSFLCFASTLRGNFVFKNFKNLAETLHFLKIINSLGIDAKLKDDTLVLKSNGALHLFEPKKAIDVKGQPEILFALCGLFAPYDYHVFFIDSTNTLDNTNFHALILGLYDVGVRFSYGHGFSLPFSMRGTSNLLPMTHEMQIENPLLELAFFNLGLQTFGKTHIISPFKHGYENVLETLSANFSSKILDDGSRHTSLCLHPQAFTQTIEIDLNTHD